MSLITAARYNEIQNDIKNECRRRCMHEGLRSIAESLQNVQPGTVMKVVDREELLQPLSLINDEILYEIITENQEWFPVVADSIDLAFIEEGFLPNLLAYDINDTSTYCKNECTGLCYTDCYGESINGNGGGGGCWDGCYAGCQNDCESICTEDCAEGALVNGSN